MHQLNKEEVETVTFFALIFAASFPGVLIGMTIEYWWGKWCNKWIRRAFDKFWPEANQK